MPADDPQTGEVAGLLALMLLTDARRPARQDEEGRLVPLAEQDRARWDAAAIAEGTALLAATLVAYPIGRYQAQAAIAAVHAEARRAEDTDWPQILALYGVLAALAPGPVVTLNEIVAIAMVDGPQEALARLAAAEPALAGYHRVARRAGAPAGAGGRPRRRPRLLPPGGRAHPERAGAAVPPRPRRPMLSGYSVFARSVGMTSGEGLR